MKGYMGKDEHGINHQPYFQEAHSPVVNIFRACLGSVCMSTRVGLHAV